MFRSGEPPKRKKRWLKLLLVMLALGGVVGAGALLYVQRLYTDLTGPVSSSSDVQTITIDEGLSYRQIATKLKAASLIKSERAFEAYVVKNNFRGSFKAGTYELSPSWDVAQIVTALVKGQEASKLFTVGPGLRLGQIETRLKNAGYDAAAIADAFDPKHYADHRALAAKPTNASLEGYIYPESFRVTASTTPHDIIRQSLDQMAERLTPERQKRFSDQGLSTHEAIILASIIEKEVASVDDRKTVAQVMLKRYNDGTPLGADATYLYAASVGDGEPFPDNPSLFNTRLHTGLPPGPISNVSESSLDAVAYPSDTDYLFYVTGDDGKNYFSRTDQEHQANVAKYCTITCAVGYVPPNY